MTTWTITAKHPDGSDASVPDFDDAGDLDAMRAHLIALSPLSTQAVPQTPVIPADPDA